MLLLLLLGQVWQIVFSLSVGIVGGFAAVERGIQVSQDFKSIPGPQIRKANSQKSHQLIDIGSFKGI